MNNILKLVVLLFMIWSGFGRKHTLNVNDDVRKYIALSTFGFYKRGFLEVKLINFVAQPMEHSDLFGFSLDRNQNDIMDSSSDVSEERCFLKQNFPNGDDVAFIYFTFDFYNNKMVVNCSPGWEQPLHIHKSSDQIPIESNSYEENKLNMAGETAPFVCTHSLPLISKTVNNVMYYNTSFVIHIATNSEEGLYNLYFHSCPDYTHKDEVTYNFTMEIIEKNPGSYLSAGQMPLPTLYCTLGLLFFLSGCIWMYLLHDSTHSISKIHYLMAILVFLKSVSLILNGINYHFIETEGVHVATWAILFYIVHFLKSVLLIIIIFLIGVGWTFIKPVLVFREKILLMVAILSQVLADIAIIILEEDEEGAKEYRAWKNVYIVSVCLGCAFILLPLVWSIRHLRKSSPTPVNLRKLNFFKWFCLIVICYTYITRISVYILSLTVSFQYVWYQELLREMAIYVFFILTAYKFRPAVYDLLTENENVEGLTRVNPRIQNQHGVFITEVTEEEGDALLLKKEDD